MFEKICFQRGRITPRQAINRLDEHQRAVVRREVEVLKVQPEVLGDLLWTCCRNHNPAVSVVSALRDVVQIDGYCLTRVKAGGPRVHGEPASDTHTRARESPAVAAEALSVVLTVRAAPDDCETDHLGNHPV